MPEPAGVVLLDGIFIAADVRRDADLQAVGVFDQFTKRLFIVRNAAVLNIQPPVFMHCQNLASAFRHDAEAFGVRVMAEVVEVMIQCHRWKMPFYRSVPDDESPVVAPLPWQIVMTAGIFWKFQRMTGSPSCHVTEDSLSSALPEMELPPSMKNSV